MGKKKKHGVYLSRYSGEEFELKELELSNGTIKKKGLLLGEKGRGRRQVFLPAHLHKDTLPEGTLISTLMIGRSRSGRPVLNRVRDNDEEYDNEGITIIVDTFAGSCRAGDGRVYHLGHGIEHLTLVARAIGAEGEAGKVGNYDALVVKTRESTMFLVLPSGGHTSAPYFIQVDLKRNEVWRFDTIEEIAHFYDDRQERVPFTIKEDDSLDMEQWRML